MARASGPPRAVPKRTASSSSWISERTSASVLPHGAVGSTSGTTSGAAGTPNFLPRPPPHPRSPPPPPQAPRPPALAGGLRRRQHTNDADELEAEYGDAPSVQHVAHTSADGTGVAVRGGGDEHQHGHGHGLGEAAEEEDEDEKEKEANSSRAVHAGLMGELVRMATVLKGNSIALGQALERDRHLVENAEDKLSTNLDFMTRTRGRLGKYTHIARSSTWLTIYSVVTVVASWILIFVVIRIT